MRFRGSVVGAVGEGRAEDIVEGREDVREETIEDMEDMLDILERRRKRFAEVDWRCRRRSFLRE